MPISGFLARFKDARISVNERMTEITALGIRGDEQSIEILIALGDEKTYLNFAAVRALGICKGEVVAEYLLEKLSDPDSRVLCEAVRSYAKVRGEEAVADIVDVIRNNHERSDGFEKEVCTMAVNMLGEIASEEAVPALISELERSEEKGWNLEYGSAVIAALARIDTPDARNAISEYADRLAARVPEDPLARKYYEDKIKEARTAAEGR
jgi:HEAT repeat protein